MHEEPEIYTIKCLFTTAIVKFDKKILRVAKNSAVALFFKGALKLKQVRSGVYLVWLQKAWRYFDVRDFVCFS